MHKISVKIRAVHPKIGPLALHTRSESFAKASHWPPFKSLARGIPFLCLWQGGFSDVPLASSSPDCGKGTSQLGKWHHHLIPEGRVLQGQVPILQRMVGKRWPRGWPDMFPISNSRGYISIPWASRGQTCSAVPQAVRKDWQSLSSSSMASLSRPSILSLSACCRVQAWFTQAVSASWKAVAHVASASQTVDVHWAFASQMASVV